MQCSLGSGQLHCSACASLQPDGRCFLQLDQSALLTELQPAEHGSHFAAPSAGTAAAVGLADMAALGSESPSASGADAIARDDPLSDGEADSAGDAMDEADGPQPTAASRQQQSRWVPLHLLHGGTLQAILYNRCSSCEVAAKATHIAADSAEEPRVIRQRCSMRRRGSSIPRQHAASANRWQAEQRGLSVMRHIIYLSCALSW